MRISGRTSLVRGTCWASANPRCDAVIRNADHWKYFAQQTVWQKTSIIQHDAALATVATARYTTGNRTAFFVLGRRQGVVTVIEDAGLVPV